MKSALPCAAVLLAALAFDLGVPRAARAASQPAPDAPPAQSPPPKSVFAFEPGTAKDPFFPKTVRFKSLIVKTNDAELPPAPLFPDEIRCQGFSGTASRPLAIINNKTVEKGERFDLFVKGQRVRVHCVDIKDKERIVVLEVNGVTKELKLRTALQ